LGSEALASPVCGTQSEECQGLIFLEASLPKKDIPLYKIMSKINVIDLTSNQVKIHYSLTNINKA